MVVVNLSLHRDKPGGGERRRAGMVVVNLALHQDKPGGGERRRAGVVVANLSLHRNSILDGQSAVVDWE